MSKPTAKKWLMFTLRWGIAVAGIAWVLANTSFQDRLLLLDRGNTLTAVRVLHDPDPDAAQFEIYDTRSNSPPLRTHVVARTEVWTRPGQRNIRIYNSKGQIVSVKLLATRPGASDNPARPEEWLVRDPDTGKPVRINASQLVGPYRVHVHYPLVDIGLARLVKQANLSFFLAAMLILPLGYLITSRRWHLLLEAMEIHLSQARTFIINMVGAFYNTFMPGSTGGDLIKAYYAAKHTTHKVRAVLSVIVDRVIGLLALIILGGVMATAQWHVPDCQRIAIICGALLLATVIGLVVFYHPTWRRITGLNWLLKKLPMQRHVHHAVEAMELYGRKPRAALTALVMTFPLHITTIISATLAGQAFGLKMSLLYYWTVVPVLALVGAIPISPQGVGVMESFAVLLTQRQGVTVSQAIALAMSIRIGQMLWNLVAGIFVLRGGYHAPTEQEQEEMEQDEPSPEEQAGTATSLPSGNNGQPMLPLAAETKALREAYAALNRNDIPAFVQVLDPQIERIEPADFPQGGTYHGLAAVTAHLTKGRGTWAEGSCEPERFIVAGNRVIALIDVRVRLKHETEWREGRIADVFTFRNGKAIQFRTFADRKQALEWAGVKASDAN